MMQEIQVAIAALTAIILFVFGLDSFSKEIQRITGERFRKFLGKATNIPIVGVLIGAVVTAFIQSSSATSVITISLVNAGVLSFKNSVGIIFGSNIGTTVTTQLVAFKLTAFAPFFIIIGYFLSLTRTKYSIFAKSLFYFGFVFFSLNLISSSLAPLQQDERIVGFLTQSQSPLLGVLIGCLITALIQSSSVTTGLAVIFTQQGLLSLDNAVPIVMGANIGTTLTAALAIINMDLSAKKTALTHFLFNLGGVLLFLPLIYIFKDKISLLSSSPTIALANFHVIFNITTSLIFLLVLHPFTRMVDSLLGEGKMDFERFSLNPLVPGIEFDQIRNGLMENLEKMYKFLQENHNLVTLSIETNYKSVLEASEKRIEYIDFIKSEIQNYFSQSIVHVNDEQKSKELIKIISLYEYGFQLHDSIKDLLKTKKTMDDHFIEIKSDLIMLAREVSSKTLSLFDDVGEVFYKDDDPAKIKKHSTDLQQALDEANTQILKLIAEPERNDAASLVHIITYTQRLRDKLVSFHKLMVKFREVAG